MYNNEGTIGQRRRMHCRTRMSSAMHSIARYHCIYRCADVCTHTPGMNYMILLLFCVLHSSRFKSVGRPRSTINASFYLGECMHLQNALYFYVPNCIEIFCLSCALQWLEF